ncbi:MAG: SDR family oxidoreductase [Phycisphaeraceae bacterium]|nr:SDR family oxidoreductase [Phycisphaerales bacterium]MCB9859180.1 SDR family oxidoreductase [Phycisphaeraceae bacterium]
MSEKEAARPVALITGASKRVGQAIACEFASRGFDLILTWHTTTPDATIEKIRTINAALGTSTYQVDMNDTDRVRAWTKELAEHLPRLDVLVHNASIYHPTPLHSIDTNTASTCMRINALSPLLMSVSLAPLLAKSALPSGGAIVCMCDIHAMGLPRKNHIPYSMSKAALTEMVRSLAVDLAPNVRVNGVAPGVVAWPEDGPESDEAIQQQYLSRVPLNRAGTPEDAVSAVAWLACDAAYVTGHILPVDGGRSLK